MTIHLVVLMILSVSDTWTGDLLYKREQIFNFSVRGNLMQDCIETGVPEAKRLALQYRANGRPHASANVACKWVSGSET